MLPPRGASAARRGGQQREGNASCLNFKDSGVGEMAEWLRAPVALAEIPISIPSSYMVAHNHLYLRSIRSDIHF